jgi:hypothetical protein
VDMRQNAYLIPTIRLHCNESLWISGSRRSIEECRRGASVYGRVYRIVETTVRMSALLSFVRDLIGHGSMDLDEK